MTEMFKYFYGPCEDASEHGEFNSNEHGKLKFRLCETCNAVFVTNQDGMSRRLSSLAEEYPDDFLIFWAKIKSMHEEGLWAGKMNKYSFYYSQYDAQEKVIRSKQ